MHQLLLKTQNHSYFSLTDNLLRKWNVCLTTQDFSPFQFNRRPGHRNHSADLTEQTGTGRCGCSSALVNWRK